MNARYVMYLPKVTEMFLLGEDEKQALERGKYSSADNEYDVVTVFRVEGEIKTPIAFFWNGQKFTPQSSADKSQ